jgi:PAS domain S-box-containing protein
MKHNAEKPSNVKKTKKRPPRAAKNGREIEEKLVEIGLNSQADTFFIFELSTGNAFRWNEAFRKLSGYRDEEIRLLKAPDSYYSEADVEKARAAIQEILHGGTTMVELSLITKNGQIIPTEYIASAIQNREGDPRYIVAIGRDISSRKRAEEALSVSESRYRLLFENAPLGILLIDPQGVILDINATALKLLGSSSAEATKKFNVLTFPPLVEAGISAGVRHCIESRNLVSFETTYTSYWGVTTRAHCHLTPILDDHDRVFSIQFIVEDITERSKMETALLESERHYHDIFAHAPIGVYQSTYDGRLLTANLRLAEILGYDSASELMQLNLAKDVYWDPEERASLISRFEPTGSASNHEVRWKKKNGDQLWIALSSHAVKDESGTTLCFEGFVEEITDRKLAQEALRESEEKFRTIAEQMNEMIFLTDTNGTILYVSPAAEHMFGFTPQQMQGHMFTEFLVETDIPRAVAAFARDIAMGVPTELLGLEMKRNDGTVFTGELNGTLYRKDGIAGSIGLIRDITDRKKAGEALRESEARFSSLFKFSPVAMTLTSMENGTFNDVNDVFLRDSGYTREEVIGKTSTEIAIYANAGDRDRLVREVLTNGRAYAIPMVFREKDGSLYEGLISTGTISIGGKGYFLSTILEIGERKRAEEALRKSEEKFSKAFFTSPDAITITRLADGMLLEINEGFVQMTGYSAAEVLGKTTVELAIWANIEDRDKLVREVREHGRAFNIEARFRVKDGSIKTTLVSSAIISVNDEPCMLSIVRDITERRRAEEEKERLQAQLIQSQKLESIGTLAAGVAHDFNNILNAIIGNADLISNDPEDLNKTRRRAESIAKSSERGAQLVKQLLTLARKTQLEREQTNVNVLVLEMTKLIFETFPKTIKVETDLQQDIPESDLDHNQIHQVLLNLSLNARDAMPEGGVIRFKTAVRTKSELIARFPDATFDRYIEISVRDNGIGVDEKTRLRIFEPFFTTKGYGKGTGLGLSVVLGIIQNHQGHLEVTSAPGKGTEFKTYLPVTFSHHEEIQPIDESQMQRHRGNETILFVEDEEFVMDLAIEFFTDLGYTVLAAKSGPEGLECFMNHRVNIDLVVSDYGLPGFDGQRLFEQMKKVDSRIRFILATGFIEGDRKAELLALGILEIVHKPYKLHEINCLVRTILDHK